MNKSKWTITQTLSFIITVLCFAITLIFYPKLPKLIAVHWDIEGKPNVYMIKYLAIFLIPFFTLFSFSFPFFIPNKIDDFKLNWYNGIFSFIIALFSLQIFILLSNIGIQIDNKFFLFTDILIFISIIIMFKKFLIKK